MLEHPPYEHLLKGENIPIDIVYEDEAAKDSLQTPAVESETPVNEQ